MIKAGAVVDEVSRGGKGGCSVFWEGCHGRKTQSGRAVVNSQSTGIRGDCLNFSETEQMPRRCLIEDFDRLFCWWRFCVLVDREIAVGSLGQKVGKNRSWW